MIDSEHGGAPIHLGQIADSMEIRLEGIAPVLGLTDAEVSEIESTHPTTLRHQVLVCVMLKPYPSIKIAHANVHVCYIYVIVYLV